MAPKTMQVSEDARQELYSYLLHRTDPTIGSGRTQKERDKAQAINREEVRTCAVRFVVRMLLANPEMEREMLAELAAARAAAEAAATEVQP